MTHIQIAGLGWVTPLGDDLVSAWRGLLDGKTGFLPMESEFRLRNSLAAVVPFHVDRPPSERLLEMARSAIAAALLDAGPSSAHYAKDTYLVLGTSYGARLDDEVAACEAPDLWVQRLASEFDAIPLAISTACSSGSDAILVGAELILAGVAKRCICGGIDLVTEAKRVAHSTLGTMSNDMLRSFDSGRSGTLLGEGAAVLVLEAAEYNPRQTCWGVLRGWGSANDAAGLTAPDVDGAGLRLAVIRCLEAAGVSGGEVAVINAHASGTLTNDRVEASVYGALFGDTQPTVFATKGALGHSLGATGAIEAVTVLLGLRTGYVPPIAEMTDPIDDLRLQFSQNDATAIRSGLGLSVTIGFGGFNTALLFEGGHQP